MSDLPWKKPITSDEPWGRQACDTNESWEAFVEYRDMRNRRLRRVTKAPVAQVQQWYREHGWRERIAAYDSHLDGIIRAEREEVLRQATREVAAEHMEILASAREVCALEFARIASLTRESRGANAVLKTPELIKLLHETVKLDRLVRNESTENVSTGIDLSKLTEEELETYGRLLDKATSSSENDAPAESDVH